MLETLINDKIDELEYLHARSTRQIEYKKRCNDENEYFLILIDTHKYFSDVFDSHVVNQ